MSGIVISHRQRVVSSILFLSCRFCEFSDRKGSSGSGYVEKHNKRFRWTFEVSRVCNVTTRKISTVNADTLVSDGVDNSLPMCCQDISAMYEVVCNFCAQFTPEANYHSSVWTNSRWWLFRPRKAESRGWPQAHVHVRVHASSLWNRATLTLTEGIWFLLAVLLMFICSPFVIWRDQIPWRPSLTQQDKSRSSSLCVLGLCLEQRNQNRTSPKVPYVVRVFFLVLLAALSEITFSGPDVLWHQKQKAHPVHISIFCHETTFLMELWIVWIFCWFSRSHNQNTQDRTVVFCAFTAQSHGSNSKGCDWNAWPECHWGQNWGGTILLKLVQIIIHFSQKWCCDLVVNKLLQQIIKTRTGITFSSNQIFSFHCSRRITAPVSLRSAVKFLCRSETMSLLSFLPFELSTFSFASSERFSVLSFCGRKCVFSVLSALSLRRSLWCLRLAHVFSVHGSSANFKRIERHKKK